MHKWIPRYGIKKVLLLSLLLSSLRWLLIGAFVENIVVLTLAQLLHAASFGSYHAAAIAWVFNYFKGKNHGRGQAIYSSVSFGLGGAIGSLYSGYMWLQPGSLSVFVIASILAFLGFVIGLIWLKN
jgi:PPP family 3-phenylpropionic acid transporter